MDNSLIDLSKNISFDQTNLTIHMSDVYYEIAKENHHIFKQKIEALTTAFKIVSSQMEHYFELASDELIEKDMIPKELLNYGFLNDLSKSKTELILENPSETREIVKIMTDSIIKTSVAQTVDFSIDKYSEKFDISKVIKAGVIAIAFEAFACEALINQEIQAFMTKNQVNKLIRTKGDPAYILKLKKIIEYNNLSCDFEVLSEKLRSLMETRNKIVHFKEYKYDLLKLFYYMENNDENTDQEMFYIGELFNSLDGNCDVYKELKRLLSFEKNE